PREHHVRVAIEQKVAPRLDVAERYVGGEAQLHTTEVPRDVIARGLGGGNRAPVVVDGPASDADARLTFQAADAPHQHAGLEVAIELTEARREVGDLERRGSGAEHGAQ